LKIFTSVFMGEGKELNKKKKQMEGNGRRERKGGK